MTESASICSLTRMEPSSVAMLEPTRAVTIKPAKTGASSRARASATVEPTSPCASKSAKAW